MQKLSENGQVIEEILGWLRMPTPYLLLDATSPAAAAIMVFSVALCEVKLTIKIMEVKLVVVSLM